MNAFEYTNTPAGRIKAGESPQRNYRGQTEGGNLENTVQATEFSYSVKACGSTRKL